MNWTTILAAVVGLIGGVISGGFTAYTQLSSAEQEFSISRAEKFKELFGDLHDESKSRIALLNLWQLYPDKRDQKIIVAAAVETGQSDLIETIVGFEDEILQYSGILQTKAMRAAESERAEDFIKNPAMRILMRVDPPRAAEVLVDYINQDIRKFGDRYVANDIARELGRLARIDQAASDHIRKVSGSADDMPMLFDYILYSSGRPSGYVDRLKDGYTNADDMVLLNSFLLKSDFTDEDARPVVESVKGFVESGPNNPDVDLFDVADAIGGLKNQSLADAVRSEANSAFAGTIRDIIVNPEMLDPLRQKAMELAPRISLELAILAIAEVLRDASAGDALQSEIERQLVGIIARNNGSGRSGLLPDHCLDGDPQTCMLNSEGWSDWLASAKVAAK